MIPGTSPRMAFFGDGLTKRFPGVVALEEVSLEVRAGEVHMLLGENGAGKSTLAHVIAGSLEPDSGELYLDGARVRYHSRHHARTLGVEAVFQEFSLVPTLSVAENLYLGRERGALAGMRRRSLLRIAAEHLGHLNIALDPSAVVGGLPRGQQQLVEIGKALVSEPRVLVLDEPTASLSDSNADNLFATVEGLKSRGVGLVYITHRMQELRRIGDRVSVLRDGRLVSTQALSEVSDHELLEMMTGREIRDLYPQRGGTPGEVMLTLDEITTIGARVREISLEVRAGEIVGLAGLVGSGKTAIARAAFGAERIVKGTVSVAGEVIHRPSPRHMLDRGLCYLPGDRRTEGLLMPRPILENLSLAALNLPTMTRFGRLRRGAERRETEAIARRLDVRCRSLSQLVGTLSGGNQQKVLVGRVMMRSPRVFIFEEPTTGIDVGSRAAIYHLMAELADAGAAVLLVSSDLSEVVNLSDRVYVIRDGQVSGVLEGGDITERAVLAGFFDMADLPHSSVVEAGAHRG